jgi:hypothetical protein
LALHLSSQAGKVFDPEHDFALSEKKSKISKEEQARLREAIKNAKSLNEIANLEAQLQSGIMPGR